MVISNSFYILPLRLLLILFFPAVLTFYLSGTHSTWPISAHFLRPPLSLLTQIIRAYHPNIHTYTYAYSDHVNQTCTHIPTYILWRLNSMIYLSNSITTCQITIHIAFSTPLWSVRPQSMSIYQYMFWS